MSPEQAKGTVDVDERSDVFSLGVVLYEMLAGKRPFRGDATLDVLIAASRDRPEPLTGVPPEVAAIVDRCLAKRPEDRYASARALVEAMDAVQSTPGDRSLLSGPSIPSAEVKSAPTTLGSTVDARPARRGVRALAAAAVLVLAGAGAFVAWRSRATPAAGPAAVVSAPASSADASRRGVALTDHPLPRTGVPEAATAYGQGLQAMRDASLVIGLVQLERAVRLDPTLAAAHLRLALMPGNSRGATGRREHLAAAEPLRSALDERDQMLLKVVEADLAEPADAHEVLARARAAAAAFPDDAEVSWHLGNALTNVGHLEEARAAWQRGLELDPAYATLLWELGGTYWFYGATTRTRPSRPTRAASEIAPTAGSCRRRRDSMYMELGKCDKLEADARSMVAAEPSGTRPYEFLAMALAAENAPYDAVEQTLSRRVSVTPEGEARVEMQAQNALWGALLAGDLGAAEQAARQLLAREETAQTESEHDRPMGYLLDILQERGEKDRALAEAEAFERKAAAWGQDDPLGVRLRLVFMRGEAGRLDRAAQAAALDALMHSDAVTGTGEMGRRLAVARQGCT